VIELSLLEAKEFFERGPALVAEAISYEDTPTS
jgi:ribosomal protein L7/L12